MLIQLRSAFCLSPQFMIHHGILLGLKRYLARKTYTRQELRYQCVSIKNWLQALVCKYFSWLSDKMDPSTPESGTPERVQAPVREVPIRVPVQRVPVQGVQRNAGHGQVGKRSIGGKSPRVLAKPKVVATRWANRIREEHLKDIYDCHDEGPYVPEEFQKSGGKAAPRKKKRSDGASFWKIPAVCGETRARKMHMSGKLGKSATEPQVSICLSDPGCDC